jgi:phosphoribosylanthranilate isomerase
MNPGETIKIKICGVTRESGVAIVCGSGADYIGLLVDMPSPRSLDPAAAARFARLATIPVILLFMDSKKEFVAEVAEKIQPAGVQIQGMEPAKSIAELRPLISCEIWKGIHIPALGTEEWDVDEYARKVESYCEAGADKILLDTVVKTSGGKRMGGTGKCYDWNRALLLAERSPRPVIMAGGLNPGNVAEAIRTLRPFAVDIAGGVESEPGIKDPAKVAAFVRNARAASGA